MEREEQLLRVLGEGELEMLEYLPYASNATFLARVAAPAGEMLAVYKPRRGESPLWDFPSGTLCLREQAAYLVDRALAWDLVPPTVLRDGPAGFGAVQLFVEEDPEVDVRQLPRTHPEALRRLSLFDVVINNADRKAGHCLVDLGGRLWGVDHGIAFHEEPKLRTVIWAYAGERVPAPLLGDLERLCASDGLWVELAALLSSREIEALRARIASLLRARRFPDPGPGRNVPWPPW